MLQSTMVQVEAVYVDANAGLCHFEVPYQVAFKRQTHAKKMPNALFGGASTNGHLRVYTYNIRAPYKSQAPARHFYTGHHRYRTRGDRRRKFSMGSSQLPAVFPSWLKRRYESVMCALISAMSPAGSPVSGEPRG